jgi:hypothetical protein
MGTRGGTTNPMPQLLTRRGRLTKFTPERIEQIKNLIERGKNREEIAELLDVTVGSLQVTCSRLGISLRRVAFKSRPPGRYGSKRGFSGGVSSQPITEQTSQPVGQAQITTHPQTLPEVPDPIEPNFSIRFRYKGEERTTELPFTTSMITRLALEAEFRDMLICELVSQLLMKTIKNDLLQDVFDRQEGQ